MISILLSFKSINISSHYFNLCWSMLKSKDINGLYYIRIETTPIPSSRGVRKADPQYYFQQYPYYQRYPYQLDQIYGSIQSGEYYPSPYFGSGYFNPYYGPAIHQQQWDEDESRVPLERFFGLLASNNWRLKTVTSTFFSVSTVTSTPGCSVAGALAQCPASGWETFFNKFLTQLGGCSSSYFGRAFGSLRY